MVFEQTQEMSEKPTPQNQFDYEEKRMTLTPCTASSPSIVQCESCFVTVNVHIIRAIEITN